MLEIGLLEQIIRITCSILQKNFFYDNDDIRRFLDYYQDRLAWEYQKLDDVADADFRADMEDYDTKRYFTSYFASYHLHDTLVEDCYFSPEELDLFENILPKYTGEKEHGHKSESKRTYH